MNNIGGYFLAGGIGAVIGSGLTLLFIRKRVLEIIQEKTDDAKLEAFRHYRHLNEDEDESRKEEKDISSEPFEEDELLVVKPETDKPIDYASISKKDISKPKEENNDDAPYVIGKEENEYAPFGSIWEYETVEMTYYADGVLADDHDMPVNDWELIIGNEWKGRFGEVEADIVYVRNDSMKRDYEIVKEDRTYKEVIGED